MDDGADKAAGETKEEDSEGGVDDEKAEKVHAYDALPVSLVFYRACILNYISFSLTAITLDQWRRDGKRRGRGRCGRK